jgi:hypothetical protein
MASKFVLDTGQLDTDFVYATYGLILDDAVKGKLDQSALNPQSSFNYASTSLGNLASFAQTSSVIQVSGQSAFGAINSIAQTNVAHSVQGSSNLGDLIATANTLPTILPIFEAQLAGLSSVATAVVTKVIQAESFLGELTATIQALPEVEVTAISDLGSLIANADASSPNPPEPEQHYGSRYGYYQVQNKKKPEPVEIKPTIINYDFEPLEPLIKTIFASSQSNLFGLSTMAQSQIDFSTEQDDLDLLMIL